MLGVGNVGTEGVSFDPRDGTFVTVKEKTPQEVRRHTVDFALAPPRARRSSLRAGLGLLDLSDVQVLAACRR